MTMRLPFYDPYLSYEENYQKGPFGLFAKPADKKINILTATDFLNVKVNLPFGIPAGPLLNANYIKAAFDYGYDLCVYKTVRTQLHKSHPLPNVLAVHPYGKLTNTLTSVLADTDYRQPLSITNSFGVPSYEPDVWQPDMAEAVQSAAKGQYVIGSFQGTQGKEQIDKDYALAARLVYETGAPLLEANLSCPNEGASRLLCFDIALVERIVNQIKNTVPNRPLLLKLAYFNDDDNLIKLLRRIGKLVDGFSAINTISARPINHQHQPALGKKRVESGICGEAIRWAGLDMVKRLAQLRQEMDLTYAIVGVGGVSEPEHYQQYRQAGADAVMSATGAMWHPDLAMLIKQSIK